jgi:hypothetical protein
MTFDQIKNYEFLNLIQQQELEDFNYSLFEYL